MRLKFDVRLDNLRPQLVLVVMVVAEVCREFGIECVITSGSDGEHSIDPPSRHYGGDALDFRTRDLASEALKASFEATIRERLPADFFILRHKTHIHVAWKPRYRA